MNGAPAYDCEEGYIEKREQYELIDGEVYMMSRPSLGHMRVIGNIYDRFNNYLRGKRCQTFFEVDVHLGEKDHLIPDVIIVCNPDIITDERIEGVPDLVVEVLSPSTAKHDHGKKFRAYEKYGVKEYWIVDPIDKSVDVYHLVEGNFVFNGFYRLYRETELKHMDEKLLAMMEAQRTIKVSLYEDFTVEVADIFRDVN